MLRRLRFRAAVASLSPLLMNREIGCDPRSENVFVTYNVLSSHLASPGHYWRWAPEDLHPVTRLARVQAKLTSAIERRALIGLQEVSSDWAGELHVFFARHGYQSVFGLYGGASNGHMGVLLAYPTDRFMAEKVQLLHVGESLPTTPKMSPETPEGLSPYGFLSHRGMAELMLLIR